MYQACFELSLAQEVKVLEAKAAAGLSLTAKYPKMKRAVPEQASSSRDVRPKPSQGNEPGQSSSSSGSNTRPVPPFDSPLWWCHPDREEWWYYDEAYKQMVRYRLS